MLAMATGAEAATVLSMLETLQGARGRLDLAGTAPGGAPIERNVIPSGPAVGTVGRFFWSAEIRRVSAPGHLAR